MTHTAKVVIGETPIAAEVRRSPLPDGTSSAEALPFEIRPLGRDQWGRVHMDKQGWYYAKLVNDTEFPIAISGLAEIEDCLT